jgi:hypothetical protein
LPFGRELIFAAILRLGEEMKIEDFLLISFCFKLHCTLRDCLNKPKVWSVGQEIIRFLWNPNVHCPVHKSKSPVRILRQVTPCTPSNPISITSILILFSHLRLGLPTGVFLSVFKTKILCAFFICLCVPHALPISSALT